MQNVLLLDDNPVNLKWLELLVQRLDELPAHDRRHGDPRVPARILLTAEKL